MKQRKNEKIPFLVARRSTYSHVYIYIYIYCIYTYMYIYIYIDSMMRFVQMPWDAWWGLMVPESMNEPIGIEVSSALEGDDCVLCALSCVVAVNDNVRMINVLNNTSSLQTWSSCL